MPSFAKSLRKLSMVAVALAGYTVSACSPDRAFAPEPVASAQHGLVGNLVGGVTGTVGSTLNATANLVSVNALLWQAPVTQATASQTIGAAGGVITLGNYATLTVPAGAVSANTSFSVTRVAGSIVAFEFEPHGTVFAQPLTFEVKTAGTTFSSFVNPTVRGAYFPLANLLNQVLGTAQVSEFRNATVSTNGAAITFTIPHFSGYMVSMD